METKLQNRYTMIKLENQEDSLLSYITYDTHTGTRVRLIQCCLYESSHIWRLYLKQASELSKKIPEISMVTDLFEENGFFYYAEEYPEGMSLQDSFFNRKCDTQTLCPVMQNICRTLAKMQHENFFFSRLVPSSIFITTTGDIKFIRIISGCPKFYIKTVAFKNCIYEAPEQCGLNQNKINASTDVFRMALFIYFCMTGNHPMPVSERTAGCCKLLDNIKPFVSEKQLRAIKKALSLHPDRRQSSLSEFMEEMWEPSPLSPAINNKNIIRQTSIRSIVIFLSSVCAVLLLFIIGSSVQHNAGQILPDDNYTQTDNGPEQSGSSETASNTTKSTAVKDLIDLNQNFFESEEYGETPSGGTYGVCGITIPGSSLGFLSQDEYKGLTAVNLSCTFTERGYLNSLTGIEFISETLEKLYLYNNDHLEDISKLSLMKKLKILDLSDCQNILNYEPLQSAASLEILNLSNTREKKQNQDSYFKKILPITKIPSLKQLNCSSNQLSDISFLKDMTNLQVLDISENNISDFSPISSLAALQYLDGSKNIPDSFQFLRELNLRMLRLNHTASLQDCKDFSHMNQMEKLYLSGCKNLTSLSGLENLSQLTVLNIENTAVSNLTPIQQLNKLEYLTLPDLPVQDLSDLSHLKALKALQLPGKNITNLSTLADLPNLMLLSIFDAQSLKDLSGLETSDLSILELFHAPLHSLKGLAANKNLKVLKISDCPITDIYDIADCHKLSEVNLSQTKIKDLSPLQDKTSITSLLLPGIPASDFSFIKNLTQLKYLSLAHTSFSDIRILKDLTNLSAVTLSDTNVTKKDIADLKKWLPDCYIVY